MKMLIDLPEKADYDQILMALIGNYIRFDEKWWNERYTQLD